MTTDQPPARKARRSIVRRLVMWTLYCFGFVAVLLVATLIWLVLRDRSAHARLQERIAELRAAGLPYDNASLSEYYARGTDGRDADRWLAVIGTVQSPAFSESTQDIGPWKTPKELVPPASEPWADEDKSLEFLRKWSELRTETKELALQDRRVRLPIEFDSLLTDLSLTRDIRQLARLVYLEGQVAIRNRESGATGDSILALFGCARVVEGQPGLISQLVSTALESMATEQLHFALEADVLNSDDLKRVQARIDKRPSLSDVWKLAINGERAEMLPMFTEMRKYLRESQGTEDAFPLPLRSHDALAFLGIVDQAAALSTDDLNELYAGTGELTKLMEQKFKTKNWLARFDTILSTLTMPAITAAGEAFIQREMLARLATLGIGIRLYEDEHGELPESLDQLSELGVDVSKLMPLGDQPFGYREENGWAVLWGFQVRLLKSTPEEPPQVLEVPDEEQTLASMDAEQNRHWVWKFSKQN